MVEKKDYFKVDLFPDGMHCPKCDGVHFHPKATVLPNLFSVVPDQKGKDGKVHLWVARSECLTTGCKGFIDWTFHPDYCNGDRLGNPYRAIVEWSANPLGLQAFKDFPRSNS